MYPNKKATCVSDDSTLLFMFYMQCYMTIFPVGKFTLIYINISSNRSIWNRYFSIGHLIGSTIIHVWYDNIWSLNIHYNGYMTITRIISTTLKGHDSSDFWSWPGIMSFCFCICDPLVCISSPVYIFVWCYIPSTVSSQTRKWFSPVQLKLTSWTHILTRSIFSKTISSSWRWTRRTATPRSCWPIRIPCNWLWDYFYCSRNHQYISCNKSITWKQLILFEDFWNRLIIFFCNRSYGFSWLYRVNNSWYWRYF